MIRPAMDETMQQKSAPVLWMSMAFGIALALAVAVFTASGTGADGIRAALRLTARWSFLLFWVAYAGGALAVLFGPTFAPLARRGRVFGLAFAASHLIHVGLVVWLYRISTQAPLSEAVFIFFAIGIFWIYLLAILSFGGLSQALGPTGWRLVRVVGMNYILLAFGRDFVMAVAHGGVAHQHWRFLVAYVPFAAMSVAAPCLVFAAATRRHWQMRHVVA